MASAEENARGNSKKSGSRRAGRDGAAGAGRLSRAFGQDDAPTMDWADVDPRHIMWVLTAITAVGGAITYGRSRDGGSLMVALLLDGERETKWISPRDEPEAILTAIAERLESLR